MLEVSTAATETALTTRAAVKTELGVESSTDDAWLDSQIVAASQMCCAYLGVPMATNGTMNLGQETLVETFRLNRAHPWRHRWDVKRRDLLLSRWPVASITSIVVDDVALTVDEYEVDGSNGVLSRINDDQPYFWTGDKVVVTYVAGWLLPGMNGRNLPADIEQACISLVKSQWFARKRDPLVKSQTLPGVIQTDYWVGGTGNGALPPDVTAMLDPYRYFPMA